jgi:hypothetical protein
MIFIHFLNTKLKLHSVDLQGIFSVEYRPPLVPPQGGLRGVPLANLSAALYAKIKDKAATTLATNFQIMKKDSKRKEFYSFFCFSALY